MKLTSLNRRSPETSFERSRSQSPSVRQSQEADTLHHAKTPAKANRSTSISGPAAASHLAPPSAATEGCLTGSHKIVAGPDAGKTIIIEGTTEKLMGVKNPRSLREAGGNLALAKYVATNPPAGGTAYYGKIDHFGFCVHSSWLEGARPNEELKLNGAKRKLMSDQLVLPAWTKNEVNTLDFARELAGKIKDTLVPVGFNTACEMCKFDHSRGKSGWTGAAIAKKDFSDVDVAALAHAVGGEEFGRAVADIRAPAAHGTSEHDNLFSQLASLLSDL